MRIALTTPDGRAFEVDPTYISVLVDAAPGEWAPKVKTVVYTSDGKQQGVRETIAQIKALEAQVEEKRAVHRSHQSSR